MVVRYEVPLATADGRGLSIRIDPECSSRTPIPFSRRGAYFAPRDILTIRDAFGFFGFFRFVAAEEGPRIIAVPEAREFSFVPEPRSGGDARREEPRFERTDELTESRKYVPGDDPRRINWKLYGHSGELFVREGDPEPPPRSRYAVLLDTSVDEGVFNREEGGHAVDALASLALGLVMSLKASGIVCGYGACGQPVDFGDEGAASKRFASAPLYDVASAPDLPSPPDPGTRVVVLALPRLPSAVSALDRFLHAKPQAPVDILFWEPAKPEWEPVPAGLAARLLFRAPAQHFIDRKKTESWLDACVAVYAGKGGAGARKLDI